MLGHFPYTTLVWGCLPFIGTPMLSCCFPVHWYVLGISVCYVGIFPSVDGFGHVPPLVGGLGASALEMSICSFLYIFVVLYISHFYYSFNYYSSSYSGIFWPVISLISDSGSSLTGFPVSLDQHGVVPPPPLMLRGSGGVLGSVSVPQQQTPSLMPLLAYANYAMSSPQVGFFFRVELPTILYIICLVSAFYF